MMQVTMYISKPFTNSQATWSSIHSRKARKELLLYHVFSHVALSDASATVLMEPTASRALCWAPRTDATWSLPSGHPSPSDKGVVSLGRAGETSLGDQQ